jgi:hypothetical protein
MRKGYVFAVALAMIGIGCGPLARADTCADNQHVCADPSPECWFNPTRGEYGCSPRGWNHCGALNKTYSCEPPTNCLGDGSAPPFCSSPSRFNDRRLAPRTTPASYRPARLLLYSPMARAAR